MDVLSLMPKPKRNVSYDYDVCLSFAGEDRAIAQKIATAFKRKKMRVFFDDFERRSLWGKDLFKHLFAVYSKQSRFCVILFSPAYLRKNWTNHEMRAAQLRTLGERREYVLPVVARPCKMPDEFSTISYLDLRKDSIRDIVLGVSEKTGERIEEEGWIPEDKLVAKINRDVVNEAFANSFKRALLAEKDGKKALAKALCSVIYLCQDEAEGSFAAYLSYLVLHFRPLSKYFRRDDQFQIQGKQGAVLRFLTADARCKLYMREAFWKKEAASWKRAYSSGKRKRKKA